MDCKFRTAINGFHRGDVVAFLQNLTEKHKSQLLDERARVAAAAEENTRLRQELADLCAALEAARNVKEKPVAEPEPDLQQQELEAYRAAVKLEKEAAEKLQAAEQQAAELLRKAQEDSAAMMQKAQEESARMLQQAEQESASKLQQAEAASAERLQKSKEALAQIQEKVSTMTAWLSDVASAMETP